MAAEDAASPPDIFLLHSFVDNIWFEWQKRGNDNTYFLDIAYPMPARHLLSAKRSRMAYEDP
ncbi:Hypothetical predicted protein [Paramuricea clavata]|uniref:Uncharacterized protein n=1 Tax=Paramuricea clavata TaxID=317549 RepID=A0A6S7K7F3_PARCT|nr:Hypothetical predicted protein [Paramuricea clavata]